MPTNAPKKVDFAEDSSKALMALSKIAFSSIEQLAALNLRMARSVLADAIETSDSLAQARGIPMLQPGENPLIGPAAQKIVAYISDAQGIAADSQAEINRLVSTYFSTGEKSPGPGRSWSTGFDVFTKIARQTSSLAAANAKAIGDNTAKLLAVTTGKSA